MCPQGDRAGQHSSTHSSMEQVASSCVSVQRDKRELKPKKPLGSITKTVVPQWWWFTKQMPLQDVWHIISSFFSTEKTKDWKTLVTTWVWFFNCLLLLYSSDKSQHRSGVKNLEINLSLKMLKRKKKEAETGRGNRSWKFASQERMWNKKVWKPVKIKTHCIILKINNYRHFWLKFSEHSLSITS